MRCTPNERIEILIADLEIHIKSIQQARLLQVTHDVLHHLQIVVTLLGAVIFSPLAHLDASTIEGYILILEGRDQHEILEML